MKTNETFEMFDAPGGRLADAAAHGKGGKSGNGLQNDGAVPVSVGEKGVGEESQRAREGIGEAVAEAARPAVTIEWQIGISSAYWTTLRAARSRMSALEWPCALMRLRDAATGSPALKSLQWL